MKTTFKMMLLVSLFIGSVFLQPVLFAKEVSSKTEDEILSILMSAVSEKKFKKMIKSIDDMTDEEKLHYKKEFAKLKAQYKVEWTKQKSSWQIDKAIENISDGITEEDIKKAEMKFKLKKKKMQLQLEAKKAKANKKLNNLK